MPVFEVQGPDGKTFEIDAPDQNSALAAWGRFSGHADVGAGTSTAAATSAQPKQDTLTARNVLNAGLRGIPVLGGLTDNYTAAAQALLGYGDGASFSERYASNLKAEQAREQQFDAEQPYVSGAAQLGGGVVATAPLAAVAPLARATGMVGPLAQQVVRGAATGAAVGGADAALRGHAGDALLQGDVQPGALAVDAAKGAAAGAVLGAAAPAVARGAGAAGEWAAEHLLPGMAAPGTGRAATQTVLRGMTDDALLDPARYGAKAQELGPQGMLLDMGPNLAGQADALASLPGSAQRTLLERVGERAQGAGGRVTAAADTALGPAGTMTAERDMVDSAAKALGAQYEAAKKYTGTLDVRPVVDWLDRAIQVNRGAVRAKLQEARGLLTDGGKEAQPVSAEVAHNVRMALDDMVERLASKTDPSSAGKNAANGVRQARKMLDDVMKKQVPGLRAADEAFSAVMAQKDALEAGLNLFQGGAKSALRPDELAKWLAAQPPAVADAFRRGAVNAVDTAMGTARNDALAVRQMFGKEWNREKLALVVGQQKANDLMQVLGAETTLANTKNRLGQGSQTAARAAGQKEFENPAATVPNLPTTQTTAFGTFLALPARRAAEFLVNGLRGVATETKAAQVADMLSRRGADRDALVRELQRISQTRALQRSTREAIERGIQTVLRGAQPAADERIVR